ncbi:unnamed protein product [Pleuronectes platessa]|uniref:Uncharacterized protein n=1 Tax=Pleuronectes platessa TaxID=8262 RepID=A0A9N7YT30_PLEPL|nr:unnamed protein product [Pleuronectes platessa]
MSSSRNSAGRCIVWQGLFRREAPLMVRTSATESLCSQQEQERNAEDGSSIWPPAGASTQPEEQQELMDSWTLSGSLSVTGPMLLTCRRRGRSFLLLFQCASIITLSDRVLAPARRVLHVQPSQWWAAPSLTQLMGCERPSSCLDWWAPWMGCQPKQRALDSAGRSGQLPSTAAMLHAVHTAQSHTLN